MKLPSRPRLLLRRMHQIMAGPGTAQSKLDRLVRVIAQDMVAEVCSVYLTRAGNILELFATEGLRPEAVHATRLQFCEGLVGLVAQYGHPLNLPEAQEDPHFAYRPETGEERFHSLLGVPIVRDSHVRGVLVVQNVVRKNYSDEEVEVLQTVAMVLAELISSGQLVPAAELHDDEAAPSGTPVTLDGRPMSSGIAVGSAVLHRPRVTITRVLAEDVGGETARLGEALDRLRKDFDRMMGVADIGSLSGAQREILETYRMFAADEGWARRIRNAIQSGLSAEAAVERVQQQQRARMARASDAYLRERLSDLDELSMRLIRILQGKAGTAAAEDLPEDAILVARTLGPAELMDYDRTKLKAIVLEEGSPSSHLAIIARAIGLPLIGRVPGALDHIEAEARMIVDAVEGHVYLNATDDIVESYQKAIRLRRQQLAAYSAQRDEPAVTLDGVRVDLMMNAGLLIDLPHLEACGADGIGLFRTEFQFMVASQMPRLDVQRELYGKVLDAAGAKPVVFRTLDIGGDKPVPFLPRTEEDNPAMGWRAIRISLDRPALLRYQIRALLLAAGGRALKLMFPMITDVSEFRRARAIVDKELAWLHARDYAPPRALAVGSMLEVPSLAWQLDVLAQEADFLSIGTNDLMQFFFAADRGNPRMIDRYDLLSPAVLSFIAWVVERCNRCGLEVTVCGEMGAKPLEAMALIGLGVRCLSLTPTAVGPVKAMIRSLSIASLSDFMTSRLRSPAHSLRDTLSAYARDHGILLPSV